MRRRDVATAAPRSVGLYRVRMAEGVKSTPSDALPLSLFLFPSFIVTLNCLHASFSRDYRYIFLLPKPTPFFPFVSSKGIFGYQISSLFLFFHQEVILVSPLITLSPSFVLSPSHFYIIAILVGSPSPLFAFVYTRLSLLLVPSSNPRAS